MRFVFERVSGPEVEPVDLAWMKRELDEFIDVTDRDDDITAKIQAAREWAEDYTGRALVDQTWRLSINLGGIITGDDVRGYNIAGSYYTGRFNWASRVGEIMLRRSPVLAVTSFVSVDADGVETAIAADSYALREASSKYPRVVPKSNATWNTETEMRVTFRAGFVDRTGSPVQAVSLVPQRFRQAMILHVRANYDDEHDLMKAAENLLRTERVHMGFA